MTGSTVRIVTKLTQPPQAGRALSAAVGDASEALANVSRLEGEVFIAEVPRSLLKQLERVGLVEIKITIMNGARATEFRFAPQAMDILASFFSPGGL